jgi:hypothetical protein
VRPVVHGGHGSYRERRLPLFAKPEQKAAREQLLERQAAERRAAHEQQRQAVLARLQEHRHAA